MSNKLHRIDSWLFNY